MIERYLIKLLPVFIWILSQHLHAANEIAIDASNVNDTQTAWRPTAHQIFPTADLSQLYESKDDSTGIIQRRFDKNLPAELENHWQPTIVTADEQQPTAGFIVSASHSFGEDDTMPAIDKRNDWKSIVTDVQSPVLRVQNQLNVDRLTGDVSDRPHYEPWIQRERERERFVSSTFTPPTSTTQRFNKSYRKPFVSSRRNEDDKSNDAQINDNNGRTANLRNILKHTGGLSLSEILQQQNLSLEDLLKGKQNALKALQNTAAPPSDPNDEDGTVKTNRRLPSLSQLNVVKPRRNFFNGTTRVTNSDRSDSSSTQGADYANENSSIEKQIISTIPTYSAEIPASKYVEDSNERRMPPIRDKFNKEIITGIRSDLDNSNLRKRMPNMKFLKSKHRTTSTAETFSSESNENETHTDVDNATETNEEQKVAHSNVSTVIKTEAEAVSTSTTTTVPKYNIRERLTLRPPRLRNVPSVQPSSIIQTAIASAEPSSTSAPSEEISSRVTTTSEESLPYTIIYTFTTQSNEPKTVEPKREILETEEQPVDDLNKKLNESVPELNLVDLEDESKSKEVTSLEDLFINDSLDPESNDNSAEMNEFIHASSTSRSDSIYKSEKPNSLKIFGGNLVNIIRKTIDKLDVTERNPGLFTDITSKFVDDKTELMDLLNDRRGGARLVKVLRQRNMTVDELLDHRKRGSSQVHLAEIFFSRSNKMTTQSTLTAESQDKTNVDIVTAFKNFPDFNLENVKSVNPDEIKTDSQGSSYFTSITNIQPTSELIKESRAIRKPFVIKLAESSTGRNIPTQLWNIDNIDSLSSQNENNLLEKSAPATSLFLSKQHILRPSTGDETNINTAFHDVVESRNDAAARSHDPLDLELSGHGYKRNNVLIENAQMPIGVRSAIVASASIVLISLTIFMVIFLVCRWRQRRKRKICYSDRFQALRGRLPILNGSSRDISTSKRSTSPAIAYLSAANSSRRNSKLNTMDPNSPEVQEYLYDAMRKPFQ